MTDLFLKIGVCLLAGLGAGLGTGFAGLSAAAVIFAATAAGYAVNEKMLTRLFDYDHYSGIALSMPSSDVVFAQLMGIAEFFGCRASSRLFSARGVASLLGFAMMGLCALAL